MTGIINNIIYIYFFACITILNYNSFSKTQKIVLIYISTIAMRLFVPTRLLVTLPMFLVIMFIIEEYLNPDQEKMHLIRGWGEKTLDFGYVMIFHDAGIWMIVTLLLTWGYWKEAWEQYTGTTFLYYILIFIFAWLTMHKLCSPRLIVKDYKDIIRYFDRFTGKDLNLSDWAVREKLVMLTELEDQSYFIRENSYNWISMEFLRYKIGRNRRARAERKEVSLTKRWKYYWKVLRRSGVKACIRNTKLKINNYVFQRRYWILSAIRRIRGGSTLEMQLSRNIAIEEGYNYKVRRKFFELAFTSLFYPGLFQYYERKKVTKRYNYKEFILYVYLHSVPVRINEVSFESISQVLQNANGGQALRVEDYNMSQLYVAYLALTNAPVTTKRLLLYPDTVRCHGIDLDYAKFFAQLIERRKITSERMMTREEVEEAYRCYKEQLSASDTFYWVNGTILPYIENNVLYAGPDWPSYGLKNCWYFALSVYWKIWDEGFNSMAGTKNDFLKGIPEGQERAITDKNTKKFLGSAVPGAVIRLADRICGNDSGDGRHHSQILLKKDDNGVVIYQSTDDGTSIRYFTWKEYVEEYREYKYFKYIKWPISRKRN